MGVCGRTRATGARAVDGWPPRRAVCRLLAAVVWWIAAAAHSPAHAALPARPGAPAVVLLIADRLERADPEHEGPNLSRCREAAVGLRSRFLLSSLPESACVALGAGTCSA